VATAAGHRYKLVTAKSNVTGLPARHGEMSLFQIPRQVTKGV